MARFSVKHAAEANHDGDDYDEARERLSRSTAAFPPRIRGAFL
jgi:hypothetical protein